MAIGDKNTVVVVAGENTNQEQGRCHSRDVVNVLEIRVGRVEDVIAKAQDILEDHTMRMGNV